MVLTAKSKLTALRVINSLRDPKGLYLTVEVLKFSSSEPILSSLMTLIQFIMKGDSVFYLKKNIFLPRKLSNAYKLNPFGVK